jgi:hypothetical protein
MASLHSGHSSPGNLHLEQVLSYGFRQMPQTSSSGISHRQAATAFHSLIVTFIVRRRYRGLSLGRNCLSPRPRETQRHVPSRGGKDPNHNPGPCSTPPRLVCMTHWPKSERYHHFKETDNRQPESSSSGMLSSFNIRLITIQSAKSELYQATSSI